MKIGIKPKTTEQIIADYISALEAHMDALAKAKGYDDRKTCALRAGIVGSPFQVEGVKFALWMDNCYALGYTIIAEVQSGVRAMPTIEEFIAELPVLVW